MSSIKQPDLWEQLFALRGLTSTVGALHEAQMVQLRCWPLVVAPHSTSHETHVDLEKKEVDFHLKVGKKRPPVDFKTRLQALDRSVKDMLGPEWRTRVLANEKQIFHGRPKIEELKGQTVVKNESTGQKQQRTSPRTSLPKS